MLNSSVAPSVSSVPRRALAVRIRNFKGKCFISIREESYELSSSAAFILASVDGVRTSGEIASRLATEYRIDSQVALPDVLELVSQLAAVGVLEY